MHWIWFIIVGAVVGALGRLLHPGRDPMGWLLTIGIGIVSMIIAAAISGGWLAFIIGVIVAVVLVALVGRYTCRRGTGATVYLSSTARGPSSPGNARCAVRPQSSPRQMYVRTESDRSRASSTLQAARASSRSG